MVSQRMQGHMPPARRAMRFVQRRGDVMSFEQYDQKQMAVVVAVGGVRKVLRGSASYLREPALGNCLRIVIADEEGLEILLKEDEWSGKIVKDEKYGCDFCVSLDPTWCAN
jgi:hypothetical protein